MASFQAVQAARQRYECAKAAKTGEMIACPSCSKRFKKRSWQQAFCSNKGRGNCKDVYWNHTVVERAERAANVVKGRDPNDEDGWLLDLDDERHPFDMDDGYYDENG